MGRLVLEWNITWAAAFFTPFLSGLLDFVLFPMEGLPPTEGGGGASSSGLPDLNLPAPESEPSSTSDLPQAEVELRRQMEEHVHRRLIAKSPPRYESRPPFFTSAGNRAIERGNRRKDGAIGSPSTGLLAIPSICNHYRWDSDKSGASGLRSSSSTTDAGGIESIRFPGCSKLERIFRTFKC